LLGGFVVSVGGWRLVFVILAAIGIVALAAAALRLEETFAKADRPVRDSRAGLLLLVTRWRFMRFVLAAAATTIGLFGFLSVSSFLLVERYGMDAAGTGAAFLLVAASAMAGTLASGRVEAAMPGRALVFGTMLHLCGGLILLAGALIADHPAALIGPMLLVGSGTGLIMPAALAGALSADPLHRGTASSLIGALQMTAGAATTALIAALSHPNVLAAAIPVVLAGILLLVATFVGNRPNDCYDK
jgi:DHA1 family bicyclomycin/chloramphenicol resistance-like MFS transporter